MAEANLNSRTRELTSHDFAHFMKWLANWGIDPASEAGRAAWNAWFDSAEIERERCALVCETIREGFPDEAQWYAANHCVDAIRSNIPPNKD